jgi:DNA mismatch repair protein MutS
LSIAWAAIEHLHEANRCRALFATHYHELTSLAAKLKALRCYTMRIKEWNKEIVFLHEVAEGVADRSYGIHVARMAGLPASVIARAEHVLAMLEAKAEQGKLDGLAGHLPQFEVSVAMPAKTLNPELEKLLAALKPDELSPKEALEFVYKIHALDG